MEWTNNLTTMCQRFLFLAVFVFTWTWPSHGPSHYWMTKAAQQQDRKIKESKKRLCFTIVGDIGGVPKPPYSTWMQRRVADEMAKVMKERDCRFIIALGDNFYYSGVRDVHDPRFEQTFEKIYRKKYHYVPWYFVAGNHDHLSNVSAQIAYTKVSPTRRWKFPHYFHSKVHQIPGTDRSVHIVMIDTTYLGNLCNKRLSYKKDPLIHGQFQWIEEQLKNSKSDYIIVGGHHPVLSAGSHGNNLCLLARLKPLMEKYGVTAYFSGHDHNLQHIQDPKSSVAYFVSGSGNFYNGWSNNRGKLPKGSLKFFRGISGGFALADLSDNDMTLTFVNDEGRHLYNTKLKPKRNTQHSTRQQLQYIHNTTELLRNFFQNNRYTNLDNEYWKWFKPIRLRRRST